MYIIKYYYYDYHYSHLYILLYVGIIICICTYYIIILDDNYDIAAYSLYYNTLSRNKPPVPSERTKKPPKWSQVSTSRCTRSKTCNRGCRAEMVRWSWQNTANSTEMLKDVEGFYFFFLWFCLCFLISHFDTDFRWCLCFSQSGHVEILGFHPPKKANLNGLSFAGAK